MRGRTNSQDIEAVCAAMVRMAEIQQETTQQLIDLIRENNRTGEPVSLAMRKIELEAAIQRDVAEQKKALLENRPMRRPVVDPYSEG